MSNIIAMWPSGRGWVVWYTDKPLRKNLDLWRRHLIRMAGFQRMGGRGCICGWWEPENAFAWPNWFWSGWLGRHHNCSHLDSETGEPF